MAKKIELKEHQQIMLQIMKDFADFCDKHNLTYFLDAGTLLGAVRHKGFIPWDNDADVCMLRPEFDKFYNLLESNNFMLNDHLLLEIPETTIYPFFKLGDTRTKLIEYPDGVNPVECLIYIDIFVKDGIPNNQNKAKRVCQKSEKLALWHWFYKRTIPKWKAGKNLIKKMVASFFNDTVKNKNKAYLKQKAFIKKVGTKYPLNDCQYITTLSNGEYYRRCKKEYFDDFINLEFEGISFKCPKGYDGWLKVLYGDNYMVPPPKEKQQVHNVIAEWK